MQERFSHNRLRQTDRSPPCKKAREGGIYAYNQSYVVVVAVVVGPDACNGIQKKKKKKKKNKQTSKGDEITIEMAKAR